MQINHRSISIADVIDMAAESESNSSGSGSGRPPCASCKQLRRRCTADCVFAPYFPVEDRQRFDTVHRIYGSSNVARMLQDLPAAQRADAVSSLVYEADARRRDPVYGCAGAIYSLQHQIARLQMQLAVARAQMPLHHHHHRSSSPPSSLSFTQHQHQHLDQQHMDIKMEFIEEMMKQQQHQKIEMAMVEMEAMKQQHKHKIEICMEEDGLMTNNTTFNFNFNHDYVTPPHHDDHHLIMINNQSLWTPSL